ncbi:MAG: hypothetical protein ACFFAE_10305 [Candidatus Hodarchaeota archaeon]
MAIWECRMCGYTYVNKFEAFPSVNSSKAIPTITIKPEFIIEVKIVPMKIVSTMSLLEPTSI